MIQTPKQKVIRITNLVILRYGLGDNIFLKGIIKTFISNIETMDENEINELFYSIKKIVNE